MPVVNDRLPADHDVAYPVRMQQEDELQNVW
jgi:hypothetical protein